MKIENGEGNILVGNYGENTIGNAAISLYPSNTSGITRVSFNSRYTENQSDLDVFVGRYPDRTDGRESPRLHLHGASGVEMTTDAGSIMQYDADTYGDQVYFSSDVIGMRYGSLFDATQTMVAKIDDDTYQVQVVSWYDNENSYTSQMVRTIKYFAEL